MDFYIYYQVPYIHVSALRERVMAMQENLVARFAIEVDLKHRPIVSDHAQTWMEIYLAAPDGFNAVLENAAIEYQLGPLIEGSRHTEQFVDFA